MHELKRLVACQKNALTKLLVYLSASLKLTDLGIKFKIQKEKIDFENRHRTLSFFKGSKLEKTSKTNTKQ